MLKVTAFSSSAIVQLDEAPLALPADSDAEVDRLWQAAQLRAGGTLFNGRMFSATEVTPDRVRGRLAEYRCWLAQRARPALFARLQVRPVAVSGLLECADGILFGRRAGSLTQDAERWELCPSGALEVGEVRAGAEVDYRAQVLTELREEIGIGADQVTAITPFCLVHDAHSHVWDIGIALSTALTTEEILSLHRTTASDEYSELRVVPRATLAAFVAHQGTDLVAVSAALIARLAFI